MTAKKQIPTIAKVEDMIKQNFNNEASQIISSVASIAKPDDNNCLTFGAFRDLIYCVGSIYISTNNINPGTFIGGTWESITSPITSSYAWKRTA